MPTRPDLQPRPTPQTPTVALQIVNRRHRWRLPRGRYLPTCSLVGACAGPTGGHYWADRRQSASCSRDGKWGQLWWGWGKDRYDTQITHLRRDGNSSCCHWVPSTWWVSANKNLPSVCGVNPVTKRGELMNRIQTRADEANPNIVMRSATELWCQCVRDTNYFHSFMRRHRGN